MSPPAAQWRFTLGTVRALRLLVYVAVALTVGPFVGFLAVVLTTLASAGVDALVVAVAIALVVGLGVGSGRALFALADDDTATFRHADSRALSRRWLVGSALVGAAVTAVVLLGWDDGAALWLGSVVAGFVALAVGTGLRSEGAVDGREGVVTYDGEAIPLDGIRRVDSVRLGRFVLAWVRYHRGRVDPSTPRFLVLSAAGRDAVESAIAGRDDVSSGTADDRGPVAIRAVAAVFGVGCVVVGPVVWFLVPEGRFLAAYLGAFGLLFGALFLRYALVA